MIRTLIEKDVKLFFRNQFFAVITALGIVAFVVLFYLLPAKPDDTLHMALYIPPAAKAEMGAFLSDALDSELVDSPDELLQMVEDGDYSAGLILTEEILAKIKAGQPVDVTVYTAPGATVDLERALQELYTAGLNNLSLDSAETQIKINDQIVVLGPDFLGIDEPLALRDRMLPMLLMMVFSIELIGLANLISEEVTRGTVKALLVTPLSTGQFFAAKMAMGMGLAFLEVLVLIASVGKLAVSPAIVVTTLLVGSLLMTGVAFLVAAFSTGFMSVMAWSVLFLLLLMLPGLGIMFPTMASDWIKAIPSFYLVDALHRTLNYGAGWGDVLGDLGMLLACGVVFLGSGTLILRRRFQ